MAAVYLVSLRTLFRLAPSPNILLFLVSRQETRRGVPFYFTFPPQIRPEDNFNLLRISCQLNCAPYDWAGLRGAAVSEVVALKIGVSHWRVQQGWMPCFSWTVICNPGNRRRCGRSEQRRLTKI